MPSIVSVQVGMPQTLILPGTSERTWTTGFLKLPVTGSVWLSATGFTGDGQADGVNHGGPDKAVCVYPEAHFSNWAKAFPEIPWTSGSFGENLTVAECTEATVAIGDVFLIGEQVQVQISQPRQPCWKLAQRWGLKDLALRVQQTGFTGWYLRVLQPGHVTAGDTLRLIAAGHPRWTISAANTIMHHRKNDGAGACDLAACRGLSVSWQQSLSRRVIELTRTSKSP